MASVLVLGGTAWLGRLVADEAVAAGHQVTCLARGQSGDVPAGVRWVRADRDAAEAHAEVCRQDWDAVIDVSWQPGQVASAVAALADRAAHWTYVSSVSVYDGAPQPGDAEDAPLAEPWPGDTATLAEYARAKVRCEQLVTAALGERALLARAGLLVGPGDPTDRFGYWVGRLALADRGPVLVPDLPEMPVQVLDARDLARWLVSAAAPGLGGPADAVGRVRRFADVLAEAVTAAGFAGELVHAEPDWLVEQEVHYWSGPRSLPLWLPMSESAGVMARSGARAAALGLRARELPATLADTLADERQRGLDRSRRAGLERSAELALIRALS